MKIFKKKNKIYEYHIFYHCKAGLGSIVIGFKKKITSPDDLVEIKEYIEKENILKSVGIANFQLLRVKKKASDNKWEK